MSDPTDRSAGPRTPAQPVPARDAATVLLVRDGDEGLEVFMAVRHREADFASGALVFPGGAVDPGDADPALAARLGAAGRLPDRERALRVAAIREAFEECGVLLARPRGCAEVVDRSRVEAIRERFREPLARHQLDMRVLAESEDLELAAELLVPFAHWITPTSQPKRFDTHFFLAPAPSDQVARHDGTESVESVWISPRRLCEEADAGRWHVMFPTRLNIERLQEASNVEAALAQARARPVVTVLPEVERAEGGRRLRIPPEAGYGVAEVFIDRRGAIRRLG